MKISTVVIPVTNLAAVRKIADVLTVRVSESFAILTEGLLARDQKIVLVRVRLRHAGSDTIALDLALGFGDERMLWVQ